ncbi:hypothetical protein [uncultured Aliiroseovarius sp.]|nr:hypothetical protein [uncultured Aliiroseovarius sp.]
MIPAVLQPREPDAATLARAATLIAEVEAGLDNGESAVMALRELRSLTEQSELAAENYYEISGAMSYEDAATLAFCPQPEVIADLTFQQFRWICEKMQATLCSGQFEFWFQLFRLNARNSRAGDLFFNPPEAWVSRLIEAGEIPADTKPNSFSPSAQQLAEEAWKSDAILL